MKNRLIICMVSLLLLAAQRGPAQGFINLNFESANVPNGTSPGALVSTNNAIPGWVAYTYGSPSSDVIFNSLSLGAAAVSLQGPGSGQPTIEGNYFVILQGSTDVPTGSAAIGQSGEIPTTAQSFIFWGYAGLDNVSFKGQTLPLFVAETTPNYDVYEANISALDGQTGQLLFAAPPGFQDYIDNIMFSTTPVPEPGTLALFGAGAALLALCRYRKLSTK